MRRARIQWIAVTAVALIALLGAGTAVAGEGSSGKSAAVLPLDLNKASAGQLTELPGIGTITANRIVEWRDEHGPFRRIEDLMKVKGIGEKSFEKLRPHVKVSGSKSR